MDTVTIPKKEYEELLESQKWLDALENAVVPVSTMLKIFLITKRKSKWTLKLK